MSPMVLLGLFFILGLSVQNDIGSQEKQNDIGSQEKQKIECVGQPIDITPKSSEKEKSKPCKKKSYLSRCSSNEDCDSKKNLSCFTTSSGCNCPSTSLPNMCDCEPSSYWNSKACVKRKSYGEPCKSGMNYECGDGFYCNSFVCRCANDEYWNNSQCVSKLVLYFSSTNYTTFTINNYNGNSFNGLADVKVIEQPSYSIYLSFEFSDAIVQLDQSGSYIRHVTISKPFGLQPVNNDIYVSSRYYLQYMYRLTSNLDITYNAAPSTFSYVVFQAYIRYNPSNGYLYECDQGTAKVNAFDLSFNRIDNESFSMTGYGPPFGITFYQSKDLGSLIIVTKLGNCIQIVNQSDKTIYKTVCSVCSVGDVARDIFMDQKSGYFLVHCSPNIIKLWYTNGTDFIDTGKTLNIPNSKGMWFDSDGRLLITSDNSVVVLTA